MKTGVKICDAMTKKPVNVSPEMKITEIAQMMNKEHVGSMLVVKDNKLQGIITEQDIVRKMVAQDLKPGNTKASDIMHTDIISISPEEDIYEALVIMKKENIRHLPVMDEEKMIGFLTIKDILKIEPQLFEIMVEKFELREEEEKPIRQLLSGEPDVCEICGSIKKR